MAQLSPWSALADIEQTDAMGQAVQMQVALEWQIPAVPRSGCCGISKSVVTKVTEL